MIAINKQDILKTVLIIWFIATTGYVVYDQYASYKIRGIQAAYQQGYTDSITALIDQTEKSGCTPFEVRKEEKKIQMVDGQCLQQAQAGVPQGAQAQQQTSQIQNANPKVVK